MKNNSAHLEMKGADPMDTPTDLSRGAVTEVSSALRPLLADVFALYVKTKNFHWHMSGTHYRDYHLLLDEHAGQIFATIDVLAERVRKLGELTIHSIGEISRLQKIKDDDDSFVDPLEMIRRLMDENK